MFSQVSVCPWGRGVSVSGSAVRGLQFMKSAARTLILEFQGTHTPMDTGIRTHGYPTTVNKRAVRILLECFLVCRNFFLGGWGSIDYEISLSGICYTLSF